MGMNLKGGKALTDDLNQLASLLQSGALQNKLGLAAIRIIRTHTRKGQDADGNDFPAAPTATGGSPYSPGHARKRARGLGAGKALTTARKTLEYSEHGGMLSKIDHIVARDMEAVSVIIDDPAKEEIAGFLMQGAGTSRVKHNFFDLSDQSVTKINSLAEREVDQYLTLTNLA